MIPQPYPLWITVVTTVDQPLLVIGWADRGDLGILPVVIGPHGAVTVEDAFTVVHPEVPHA